MKTIIFYKSVLGSSKQYAFWLAEALNTKSYKFAEYPKVEVKDYDTVIVISGTYASKMPMINFITKNWEDLKYKELIAVAVGMIPPDDKQSKLAYDSIPEYIRRNVTFFKLPGKLIKVGPAGEPSKDKLRPIIDEVNGDSYIK